MAIKVFRPAAADLDTAAIERFKREGLATQRVSHPNAVAILGAGVAAADLPYLVMERLHGETIAERLRRTGTIPPEDTTAILADVCGVLADAHAAGIVHRDITPNNVFLDCRGNEDVVKVLDFGIRQFATNTKTFCDARNSGLSRQASTNCLRPLIDLACWSLRRRPLPTGCPTPTMNRSWRWPPQAWLSW